MGRFRALIPVNRLDRAKGRLGELLTAPQRAELALATLATVLDAVRDAGGEAIVLTADPRVVEAAQGRATVLSEQQGIHGLNGQLDMAVARLDGDELLIVHADLPLATAKALNALLAGAPVAPSVTLVESRDGGTNAMLLRPPGRFQLRYGAGSAAAHRETAMGAAMAVTTVDLPSLALDLDTAADLHELMRSERGRTSRAGLLLAGWGAGRQGQA